MTTTSDTLQALMVTALKAANTLAGQNIFTPRDWPSTPDKYPMLKLSSPKEHMQSQGPNAPAYDVSTTIRVIGSVQSKPKSGDAGAAAALAFLATLQRQIAVAIVNNYELYLVISEIETIDSENMVTAQGEQHIGELTMDFVLKFYQGTEDFAPPTPLTDVQEIALYGDLLDVASPTGVFVPPFAYPVTPPPRTEGPDGRVEIGALVELETESP